MKKLIFMAVLTLLTAVAIWADNQADFAKNISSYNAQISRGQYLEAARSISRAAEACTGVKNYEGAFNIINNAERTLASRHVTPDSLPRVFYVLAKARFDIYHTLKNQNAAQAQLQKMVDYANRSDNKEVMSSMLFSSAQFYYSINQTAKGDQCIARLIKQYDSANDYKGADAAYKKIIDKAVSANDARLVEHTYDSYMHWSDSIEAINADSELARVQNEYAASQKTIEQKDKTIAGKTGVIATFVALFIIALAAVAVTILFYLRIMAKNRRMRRNVEEANQESAAKSAILRNMSSQLEPTLERLDQSNPAVQNLRGYMKRVGELSDVGSRTPRCPDNLDSVDVEKFCAGIADEVRPLMAPGVKFHMDIARTTVCIDAPEVRKILLHLLMNAAKYTPENGRISLTYKKRGARVHQFIVADSGPGIPKNRRSTIFTAFSTTDDLSQGDGLGLPICALRAEKLNGKLELDPDHSLSATFVLTVRA
ncbi:MAG: hypothetical protein J6B13_09505 [Muribaculaceae bacterium]|nr:hypothetical protein [Muribaculaceae bacterium]